MPHEPAAGVKLNLLLSCKVKAGHLGDQAKVLGLTAQELAAETFVPRRLLLGRPLEVRVDLRSGLALNGNSSPKRRER